MLDHVLICLFEIWYNASAILIWFKFAMYRFHSSGFLNKTKFLKQKGVFLITLRFVKFGLINFRDLIKMKSFETRIKTISTRFLHLRISDFLKSNWFEKDKTRILLKIWKFLTIKTCTIFLGTQNSCRFLLEWFIVYACLCGCMCYVCLSAMLCLYNIVNTKQFF